MQNRLYALLMIGISAVGLTSCTPDRTKQDDWQVSAPVLKSAASGGTTVDLHSGFTGEVSADSSFTFPTNEPDQMAKIEIHSECSRNGLKSTRDRVVGGGLSVSISSILPDNIVFSMSIEKLVCQFNFALENAAGSKRTFQTRPITIGNLKSLENFSVDGAAFTTAQLATIDLQNIRRSAARINAETSITALICDQFENSRVRQKDQSDSEVLQELGEGPINLPSQPEIILREAQDSRYTDSVQTCKIVVSNQARGHATEVITSTRFALTFPATKPKIEISQISHFTANSVLTGVALLTFKIENLDPVAASYAVSTNDLSFVAKTISAMSAIRGIDEHFYVSTYGLPLAGHLEIKANTPFTNLTNQTIVEVPPNGSSIVTLQISSPLDCTNWVPQPVDLGVGDATFTGECHDWNFCSVIWSLEFRISADIFIARIIHSREGSVANPTVRNSEKLFSGGTDLKALSSARDEFAARNQTPGLASNAPKEYLDRIAKEVANLQFCK